VVTGEPNNLAPKQRILSGRALQVGIENGARFLGPINQSMRYLSLVLISFVFVNSATAVELFRYRLTMPNGREFEYIFETDEKNVAQTIDRYKAEAVAMDWIVSFHRLQIGSIESATLRQKPIPYWLVAVADITEGPIGHLLFAVILPNGVAVVPRVVEQL
jgi:hypothetical protein